LPTNLVINLYQDREKNIWLSTHLGVIKLVMQNDTHFFTIEDGLESERIDALTPGNGNYFFFTSGNHIFKMNEQDYSLQTVGPPGVYISIVNHPYKDGLLTNDSGALKEIIMPHNQINELAVVYKFDFEKIAVDDNKNIFLGGFNGIYIKTPDRPVRYFALKHRVTSLLYDNGYLWVGTWTSGLFRIKINYLQDSIGSTVENLTPVINNDHIRALFKDSKDTFGLEQDTMAPLGSNRQLIVNGN
jgi:ligand-binding sensor domain-containing protein